MLKYEFLIAPAVGYVCAQGIKFAVSLRRDGLQFKDVYVSGGFPSSHTAFLSSLTILLGIRQGFDSPIFALSCAFTSVVMYDAMGVRRAAGELVQVVEELAITAKHTLKSPLHQAKGHQPIEVLGGFSIGCLVAFVFYSIS
jgi:uncharacterized protein